MPSIALAAVAMASFAFAVSARAGSADAQFIGFLAKA